MSPSATRIAWSVLALGAASVLAFAALLDPDARGYGTHEQLGIPHCGMRAFLGVPCPGCGLTTAFAHLARADLAAALEANPAALLLFSLTAAAVPFATASAIAGRPFTPVLAHPWTARVALLVVATLLLTWIVRVCPA